MKEKEENNGVAFHSEEENTHTKGDNMKNKHKLESVDTNMENLDQPKETIDLDLSKNEEVGNELTNTDFISFDEIDAYVTYLGDRTKVPGFRKGKIFLPILYLKFPNAVDDVIKTYIQLKSMFAASKQKQTKVEKIEKLDTGFLITYIFSDILSKNAPISDQPKYEKNDIAPDS